MRKRYFFPFTFPPQTDIRAVYAPATTREKKPYTVYTPTKSFLRLDVQMTKIISAIGGPDKYESSVIGPFAYFLKV